MVYDVPRNFIGDTHWREAQAIQDGDELQLEKGVLIQVGEQVERTETDLSELLEKRKPKPAAPVSDGNIRVGPSPIQTPARNNTGSTLHTAGDRSTPAILSHLRPKTLNAVLGRPQGPVGRAALPVKSPAEHRRERYDENEEEVRSPKRRRVQCPTTTIPTSSPSTLRRIDQVPKPPEKAGRLHHQATAALEKRDNPIATTEATNLTNTMVPENLGCRKGADSNQRPKKKPKNNRDSNGLGAHRAQASEASSPSQANSRPKTQDTRREQPKTVPTRPVNFESRSSSDANRATISNNTTQHPRSRRSHPPSHSERNLPSNEDERRPENLLRSAPSKPRRKLMYRDLLPQKAPVRQTASSSKVAHGHDEPLEYLPRDSIGNGSQILLDNLHQTRRDRLRSVLSRKSEDSEHSSEQGQVFLHEDEGEYLYTPDMDPPPDVDHNPMCAESLFLTQPVSEASSQDTSPGYSRPSSSPQKANDATEEPLILQKQAVHENDALMAIVNTPPPDVGHGLNISEHLSPSRPSPNDTSTSFLTPQPNQATPLDAPADIDPIPSSKQAAHTLTAMDPVLLHQPPKITNPQPQPQPQAKSDIIKAALPPLPLSRPSNPLPTRSTRPFTRCSSDLSAQSTSTTIANAKHIPGLPKALSNEFVPPKMSKPPPPLIHTRSTNLSTHAHSNTEDEKGESIPDSRPGSALEQLMEPWSREAWDLFGFEGVEKRVGTCNGVEGGGGRGMGRGEDGWLVASQGFV
ncbi:MAG: hypothetical protein Q9186_001376 [Xanthomendoza sp. 1 TL-2023]